MGELTTLDHSGDEKIKWDKWDHKAVDKARQKFDALKRQQYLMFQAEGFMGMKGKQIDQFDPDMEHIIAVPRMVGG
jgi:hypothetical protein